MKRLTKGGFHLCGHGGFLTSGVGPAALKSWDCVAIPYYILTAPHVFIVGRDRTQKETGVISVDKSGVILQVMK